MLHTLNVLLCSSLLLSLPFCQIIVCPSSAINGDHCFNLINVLKANMSQLYLHPTDPDKVHKV